MIKPTKTFRLSKRAKTMRALMSFKDKDQRDAFKNMMIQAELTPASRGKDKNDRSAV